MRYADRVGRQNVIAGTDFPGWTRRLPGPTLKTLAEGARLASERLWAKVAVMFGKLRAQAMVLVWDLITLPGGHRK